MELVWPLDDAIHVLHGKGNARLVMVLEDRKIDDHLALSSENLGQLYLC